MKRPSPNDVCWPAKRVCTATIVVCSGTHGVRTRTSVVCTLPASVCRGTNGTGGPTYVACNVTPALGRFTLGYCGPTNIGGGPANIVGGPVSPLISPYLPTCRPYVAVLRRPLPVGGAPYSGVPPTIHVGSLIHTSRRMVQCHISGPYSQHASRWISTDRTAPSTAAQRTHRSDTRRILFCLSGTRLWLRRECV